MTSKNCQIGERGEDGGKGEWFRDLLVRCPPYDYGQKILSEKHPYEVWLVRLT